MPRTLLDLQLGETGTIARIHRDQGGAIRQRLLDMGVTRGSTLVVERVAPLGDPIEVQLKGYHLAIRKTEARLIEIA
jgi:ferrous iron transport protein A